MVDVDTFLTPLYVMVDDYGKTSLPPESHPGPQAARSRSETVTLALFGQWQGFGSEGGFSRYAHRHWRAAFPTLPSREQLNRHVRQPYEALVACCLHLVPLLAAQWCPYEALDSSGIPTRDAKHRGVGWLPGFAAIGWSNRLGWYEGFHLLLAVNPLGVSTGFGFGPASTKAQPLAETFFALRHHPHPGQAPMDTVHVVGTGHRQPLRQGRIVVRRVHIACQVVKPRVGRHRRCLLNIRRKKLESMLCNPRAVTVAPRITRRMVWAESRGPKWYSRHACIAARKGISLVQARHDDRHLESTGSDGGELFHRQFQTPPEVW
jgi:hypothetical protein